MAIDYGNDDALAVLLEKSGHSNNGYDSRYFYHASYWGNHTAPKVLANYIPYRDYIKASAYEDPVFLAADYGYLKTFESVFVPGVDVNLTSLYGTVLYHATYGKNIYICRLLLSKGADVNISAGRGVTPLS